VARVADEDSLAWVLVRFDEKHVRSAVVLALDAEELALVRLSGRLDQVLVEALRFARSEVARSSEFDSATQSEADHEAALDTADTL
jgi:hypothetical protein